MENQRSEEEMDGVSNVRSWRFRAPDLPRSLARQVWEDDFLGHHQKIGEELS